MSSMNVDVVWNQFEKALEEKEPLDVVDKIIEQNLLVLEQRFGPDGRTPLYQACYRDRLDVIERLIERCPNALTLADDDGYLPLHFICLCGKSTLDIIQLFVHNLPHSVKAKTNYHETPLHLAVPNRLSLDVIQFLYQQYPGALLDQDDDGRTPLHFACHYSHTHLPEVLQIVYHHRAARMQTRNDFTPSRTPIYFALMNRNESAIQFLLERDPVLLLEFHLRNKIDRTFSVFQSSNIRRDECVQNAALALVKEMIIKNKKSISQIEPNVIAEHLANILETRPFPSLQQLHSPNTTDEIIRVCTKQKVYDDLETLIYKPTFQTLLKGYRNMIRIDQSGFLRDSPGNKAKYIAVLAATACVNDNNSDDDNSEDDNNHNNKDDNNNKDNNNYGNVHLLFQHLRANTLLCKRLS